MTPYYQTALCELYCAPHEDVLHGQVELPHISTVISDPPWYGYAHAQRVALGIQDFHEQEEAVWLAHLFAWYAGWMPRLRQMVDYGNGRAWFFTGPTHLPALCRMAELVGWPVRRLFLSPEVYGLVQFGKPLPDESAAIVESAFRASRHHSPYIDGAILDAILSVSDGGAVLDPFMGAGGTIVAAQRKGYYGIGIEIKAELCAVAQQRLESLT